MKLKDLFELFIDDWNFEGSFLTPSLKTTIDTLGSNLIQGSIKFNNRHLEVLLYKSPAPKCDIYVLCENTKILAALYVVKIKTHIVNSLQVFASERDKLGNSLGVMPELFKYLLAKGYTIICDDGLTIDAIKFWKNLPRYGVNIKIFDAISNQIYNLSDIGKKTKDNVVIEDPSISKLRFNDKKPFLFRFYYIAGV